MLQSILISCGARLAPFDIAELREIMSYDEMELDMIGDRKTAILNDLKMLMNYEYDSLNCFTLVLCGESYLNSTLRKPVHEALRQRVTVHYEFQGLSDAEVPQYVLHKIRCAGGSEQIIDEAAMSALNSMSQHNPRIIDNIMTDAMMIAMQQDKHTIDAGVIMAATNNQSF